MYKFKVNDLVMNDQDDLSIIYKIIECHKLTCWIEIKDENNDFLNGIVYKDVKYKHLILIK